MQNTESIIADPAEHDYKRAYKRYIVNLRGNCCLGRACSPIEIRDFCLGGMYVVYLPGNKVNDQLMLAPNQGDVLTISFSLPSVPGEVLQLQGRVVRSDMKSLGISFVQPDYLVLEKIMAYAHEYQQQKINSTLPADMLNSSVYEGVAYDVLMKNVRTMTHKPIRLLLDSYLQKQPGVLLEMADKSINISEQNSYFAAIEKFKKQGAQFKAYVLENIRRMVYSAPEKIDQEANSKDQDLSSTDLTLVDDDTIDDWIARSEISDKVESTHFELLAGIEQRFSVLLNMKIWKQNNPIGPEAFSRAFQEALNQLNIDKTTYLLSCKIFRDVLNENLGVLYQEVNQYLIKHGILPDLQYEIKVHEDTGKPRRRRKSKTDLDSAQEFLDAIDGDDGNNLYDLISSLQSIKRNDSDNKKAGLPRISTQQLLSKLADLSQQGHSAATMGEPGGELKSRSLQLLNQLELGDGEYQLGTREAAIMEATGSIYDALFKDEIITPGVKQWLSEVEMPLLQEAIKDETVLADKGHIARTFINQLAKLELYNDEGRDYISNSVKRTIEGLLKKVAAQPGMNERLMSSLLKKVNALVDVQNKAYSENFSESLEQCQVHSTLPALKFKQFIDELRTPDESRLREWRKRIRRINVGDWILFGVDSHESTRLKLAWVSDNYDQYVFVSMLGLIEGVIGIDELASLLDIGAALFLKDAEEPAVDRAQYSMLQNLHAQLMHNTTHDQLTGLLNRREFEKVITAELMDSADVANSNVVCIFDVDYFDVMNTTLGYAAGDQLLVELADFLKEIFSSCAALGRTGGNEFAVLLTDCSLTQAIDIVEKQKDKLSDYRFKYEGNSTLVTLSSGVVAIDLQQHEIPRLLQTAEAACRLAKSKGVNATHVVEVNDAKLQESKEVMLWASKIDESMVNGSLILRYQTIRPISDGSLSAHSEILLGVTAKDGSIVSPVPFILAAEKYRRMQDIDRWVVKNVFSYLNANPHVLDTIGGVAINLSGLSVNDESFIPFIIDQISELTISTKHISFEITETAGIECLSSAAEFINEVKKTGCRFSLDDFGTGMSTYSYLKNLPVDFIKIDGSFVRDIENNESDRAVVKSITEIGHFMGKKIIAECAERESTIDVLRSLDVDYVQGYAISRPKPLMSLLVGQV